MTQTAIILAAGRGSRLDPGGHRTDYSKPLISVDGQTLLSRTVDSCRAAGIQRIVIVTGFNAEVVAGEAQRIDQGDIETIHNPEWQKRNGVSLHCCRHRVDGSFLLMMSDHIFQDGIFADMSALQPPPSSVTLAVDYQIDQVFDLDDATKVRIHDGRITDIHKQLDSYDAVDCGVFHCSPAIFEALGEAMDASGDCSLSEGMLILSRRHRFFPYDIGERWWQDVDTPDMMHNALKLLRATGD